MPQANVSFIRPAQIAKMGIIDLVDTIDARIEFAKSALQFSDAISRLEMGDGLREAADNTISDNEARFLALKALGEIKELVNGLYEIKRGVDQ